MAGAGSFASPWAISLEHAQSYMPLLAGLLTNNTSLTTVGQNMAEQRY